jgi:drug/metabolite transporter (DMT)-like permease
MRIRLILSFLYLSIVWGTTYLFIKIGLAYWPPFMMAAARSLLACVTLMAILAVRRNAVSEQVAWRGPILFGIINGTAMACLFWGERYISSGQAAVLIGTVPLFTMIFSRWWFKEAFTRHRMLGAAVGLGGVMLAMLHREGAGFAGSDAMRILGQAAVLVTAVGYAAAYAVSKQHFRGNLLHSTAIHLGTSGIWLAVLSALFEPNAAWPALTLPAIGSVVYLAVLGSAVAYCLKSFLLRHLPSGQATYTALINPVVAVALGAAFFGERVTAPGAAGMLLVLLGAWLVALK